MPRGKPNTALQTLARQWSVPRTVYADVKRRIARGDPYDLIAIDLKLHPALPELIDLGLWGPVEEYLAEKLEREREEKRGERRKQQTEAWLASLIPETRQWALDQLIQRGYVPSQPTPAMPEPPPPVDQRPLRDRLWDYLALPRFVGEVASMFDLTHEAARKTLTRDGRFVNIGKAGKVGLWSRKPEATSRPD